MLGPSVSNPPNTTITTIRPSTIASDDVRMCGRGGEEAGADEDGERDHDRRDERGVLAAGEEDPGDVDREHAHGDRTSTGTRSGSSRRSLTGSCAPRADLAG